MTDAQFDTFRALLNQTFRMELPNSSPADLVLTGCEPAGPDNGTSSFSLRFKARSSAPVEQGTYLLSAEGFGPEPVFLVPVRRLDDPEFPTEFEAVFNRLPGFSADAPHVPSSRESEAT